MSTTPEIAGSAASASRPRAWSALRREWIKLLFQRRSYLIWAGAVLIPFLISLAFYLTRNNPDSGSGGPPFVERITSNGMFVTLAALFFLIAFLLPMAAAMVAGYMIAGEAELGTLRIILLRPVRRGSFLLAKWAMAWRTWVWASRSCSPRDFSSAASSSACTRSSRSRAPR